MQEEARNQLDGEFIRYKARRNGWRKVKQIARRVNRSSAAVSRAFSGELPKLLARIDKLVSKPKNSKKAAA